jgi:hypothetical protein
MRITAGYLLVLTGLAATSCVAQEWELGAVGGFGFYRNATVKNSTGSGKAGFNSGLAAGLFAGNNMYERLGGEMRYMYRVGKLKVSGGGQQADFNGETHVVHYDLLYHFADRDSRFRPFVAGGGGIKVYRGTGVEKAFQPANKFALLTRTQEVNGLVSVGAGAKVALSGALQLRLEVRDFITPFPKEVIAPSPGASIKGWLHDLVPMVGIGVRF